MNKRYRLGEIEEAVSEMEELIGMSDRIIVLAEHKMTGELQKEDFDADAIMALASAIVDQKEVS